MDNPKDNNKTFLMIGILLLLIGLGMASLDIYRLVRFDKVESELTVRHKPKRGKKAYVTYEYQGTRYEDKVLASYNAFVMKDGKAYMVLINPSRPDDPKTTSFALDVMILACGIASVVAGRERKR